MRSFLIPLVTELLSSAAVIQLVVGSAETLLQMVAYGHLMMTTFGGVGHVMTSSDGADHVMMLSDGADHVMTTSGDFDHVMTPYDGVGPAMMMMMSDGREKNYDDCCLIPRYSRRKYYCYHQNTK